MSLKSIKKIFTASLAAVLAAGMTVSVTFAEETAISTLTNTEIEAEDIMAANSTVCSNHQLIAAKYKVIHHAAETHTETTGHYERIDGTWSKWVGFKANGIACNGETGIPGSCFWYMTYDEVQNAKSQGTLTSLLDGHQDRHDHDYGNGFNPVIEKYLKKSRWQWVIDSSKTIVDKAAYDETVIEYYECPNCGMIKLFKGGKAHGFNRGMKALP